MRIHNAGRAFFAAMVLALIASPAAAQRLRFEQSFDATAATSLDISTTRGAIDVKAGEPGKVVVVGTVTIRVAWDLPANAAEIARRVADHPPIEKSGEFVRLREPAGSDERRAVTVSYEVRVPPQMRVTVTSESGAISIRDVTGGLTVSTHSSAIDLIALGGNTEVTTGSGAVRVDGSEGPLKVTTKSSAIDVRRLRGGLDVFTGSGAVQASLSGPGNVRVRTQSSAIDLDGVSGSLDVSSQSGRVIASGVPRGPWDVNTGSGSVEVALHESTAGVTLDAFTKSGSVQNSLSVDGPVSKGRVSGKIRGGGPLVRLASRSGSIKIGPGR